MFLEGEINCEKKILFIKMRGSSLLGDHKPLGKRASPQKNIHRQKCTKLCRQHQGSSLQRAGREPGLPGKLAASQQAGHPRPRSPTRELEGNLASFRVQSLGLGCREEQVNEYLFSFFFSLS